MNTKHTPGPWNNGLDANGNMIIFQRRDDPYLFPESINKEWQANLQLCDAAPDLLFCLQVIVEHAGEDFDRLDGMLHLTEAKKAIAKATGGTA